MLAARSARTVADLLMGTPSVSPPERVSTLSRTLAASSSGTDAPRSGEAGDLDADEHRRGAGAGEDAGQGRHVAVVATGRDHDVPVGRLCVVGRVVAVPVAVPPLDPGV